MSGNQVNGYDIDTHLAEIYDQQVNYTGDVQLLLDLIGEQKSLRIFEPFCGTGRILIPLVQAGHQLTGMDQSDVLLNCCWKKLSQLGLEAGLIQGDAIEDVWPQEMDLVVLGGNCLYELATAREQEYCIRSAASALKPGGYLFLDNDHMEGELAQAWQDTTPRKSFPSGQCADGVRLESTIQTVGTDVPRRLVWFHRKTKVVFPDGRIHEQAYMQQKHPVSQAEEKHWLEKTGFKIVQLYGSWNGEPYTDASPRAIFWAQKI